MRRSFISHPFSHEPRMNACAVREIARSWVLRDVLPVAPQIYLPHIVDEATEREMALRLCLALLAICDEVRVYGTVSPGMRLEIAEARRLGIPVVNGETGEPIPVKEEPPQRASAGAAVEP